MSGSIALFSGMQRSGKTFLSALIATYYNKKFDIPVYTNMNIVDFTHVENLTDVPINRDPKILLLDELHFYLNSRNFKTQGDFIYFLNTVCKRNILLLGTCIHPDMIDKNLRIQLNYFILCKSDNCKMYYKLFDVQNQTTKELHLLKSPDLFKNVNYDSLEIPNMFNFNINDYIKMNSNKDKFS